MCGHHRLVQSSKTESNPQPFVQVLHDIAHNHEAAQQLHQRAVLSIRTRDVATINKQILDQAPGRRAVYLSATKVNAIDSNPELKSNHRGPHRSRLESGLSDQRWLQSLHDAKLHESRILENDKNHNNNKNYG